MVKYQFGFDHLSKTSSQNRNDDTHVELEEETNSNEVLSKSQTQLEDPPRSKMNVSSNVLRSIH